MEQVVETCVSGITIGERARVLREALPFIAEAEAAYLQAGPRGELFFLKGSPRVTPELGAELMGVIYRSHFVPAKSPTRGMYEAIRQAPPFGTCPLCGQRTVASVDHYLPQSLFPVFNLTPANLIPACSDCNKNKLAKVAERAEDQTLHPYFDDLGRERWLFTSVERGTPPAISFFVRQPSEWPQVLYERVVHHFNVMGLAELYAAQAASELADISHGLREISQSAGPHGVYAHLDSEWRTRHARDPNSWKTALYEGLRDSKWFCNQGHLLIR